MKKEVICIVCPKGCHILVEEIDDKLVFSNNSCARGPIYVRKELTNPTRTLTTTVRINNALVNQLPVVSSGDIPKAMIIKCVKALKEVEVEAPIKVKDVVYKDIFGLGIDILATKSLEKIK